MIIIENLKYIPIEFWLAIGVVAALMILIAVMVRRRRGQDKKPVTDDKPFRKFFKALRMFVFGMFSLALVIFALLAVGAYQDSVEELAPANRDVTIPDDLPFEVEEVTFLSEDGLRMAGWYVPPQNGATIILLHGYGGTRLGMRWHAERLIEAGYGVLMYDERASGESEGEHRSYGWEDPQDVGGAVAFLQERSGTESNIGIAGCSMGGQIALQGAAYYPEIGAVWADGPSTIRGVDARPADNALMGIFRIGNYFYDVIYHWKLGIEPPTPMIELLPTIAPHPIMLVGGGTPMKVTGSEAPQMMYYAQFAGDNAQVWVIDEAFHCDGPKRRPEEYAAKLVGFFDAAFGLDE